MIKITGGSQNQSGILFPIDGEVSELEQELTDMIKTTGKHKNYELIEYVNDVNREHTEVLMELNINGIMDTAYSYGNERLTNERFTGWTGYYTYDPRGSVSGVTDSEGMIWQSYRYDGFGNITFGKPQYNNVYGYNGESYNPNIDAQYLRARYYSLVTADFLTEDSYLGDITDPLTLNRYNYVKSSPLNYIDPSGQKTEDQIKGDDAYRTLQAFLTAVAPGIIEAEYLVINHPSNASGVGRADIVFHGPFGDEVCEIKPGMWSNKVVHPILNAKGQMQRQEYVTGMTKTYLESIDTDYPLPPVIYNGKSLNLIVNQLVLPSISDPTISIKYRTYATPPGMIYYDYDVHRKYGCGKVFKTRIKEAVMHSSQAEKL